MKLKNILLIAIVSILLMALQAFGQSIPALKNGTKIIKREAKQTFSKNCSAQRNWDELNGPNLAKGQSAINLKIQKAISVKKSLSAKDCPEANSEENYQYNNLASIKGERGDYLGVEYIIIFPGGSTRRVRNCAIYNLLTGQEIFLTSKIQGGLPALEQIIKNKSKLSADDSRYLLEEWKSMIKYRVSPFCLVGDHLTVSSMMDDKNQKQIELSEDDLILLFKDLLKNQ